MENIIIWIVINCEVSLTWYVNCVITSKAYRETGPDVDPAVAGINAPTNETVNIIDTKLRVHVVTLSTEDGDNL